MIQAIRCLAETRRIRITYHAKSEMEVDDVAAPDMARALAALSSELIEDYPDDRRGHSYLVLGWLNPEEPVHVCCAIHDDELVIITVYRPDGSTWMNDWRTRR